MTVEQLPFVADLDRRILLRPEYLVRVAGDDGRQSAVVRAGAVKFSAYRVRRRRIGKIDAGYRDRLPRDAEVEIRHQEIRGLLPEDARNSFRGAKTAGFDIVVIVADAAIEDQDIVVIRAIDQISARGVDGDPGGQPGQRRGRSKRSECIRRIEYADAAQRAGTGKGAAGALRSQAIIRVDAGYLAGHLDAGDRG